MPAFTKLSSVSDILTTVLKDLGLAIPSDFVGSTDVTVMQILSMFNQAGQDLCMAYDWQWLHKTWTYVTDGTDQADLPEDYNGFVNDTMWNNDSRLPVIGPLTPQIWRLLKARLLGGNTISIQYRIVANKIYFYIAPEAGQEIQADYYSRGWLYDVNDDTVFYDNVQENTDICLFDPRIIVPLVKLRWRNTKGFDTTAEQQEFQTAWDLVLGRDTPSPTFNLAPGITYPYLGWRNIPDTNYGN